MMPGGTACTCCSYLVGNVAPTHAQIWAYNIDKNVAALYSDPGRHMPEKLAIFYRN